MRTLVNLSLLYTNCFSSPFKTELQYFCKNLEITYIKYILLKKEQVNSELMSGYISLPAGSQVVELTASGGH
jgi:hypothetical protein